MEIQNLKNGVRKRRTRRKRKERGGSWVFGLCDGENDTLHCTSQGKRITKDLLTRMGSLETQTLRRKRREGWLQRCSLSYDQVYYICPSFVLCNVFQAFLIASNLDSKLILDEQDQMKIRKVCTVRQSLLSRRLNHHSGYEKDPTFLAFPRRINIVNDPSNVDKHKLFGINV